MKKLEIGCGKPTGIRVGEEEGRKASNEKQEHGKEVVMSSVMVGAKAPDFEAPAYHKGDFGQIKLSDYIGKWVALCFYPGDFTFV